MVPVASVDGVGAAAGGGVVAEVSTCGAGGWTGSLSLHPAMAAAVSISAHAILPVR
jgi:hypothetical protein